jgi:mono/diheme cytochrome c family protein
VRFVRAAAIGLIVLAAAGVAVCATLRPHLPAAERGRRLAEKEGCFGCHGPGGLRGAANDGRLDRTVPNFDDDVMMYAKTPGEIREWIRDGVSRRRAQSRTWRDERQRGALRMPAFGRRLSGRQTEDLVAYVMVVAGLPEPEDPLAVHGLERADSLGCIGCHGAGGRLARTNPGSLKGCIPSWDGPDFRELVRDSTEFRQWVERGVSDRFNRDRLASFFLRRAAVHMPGFERHLLPGDVPALWAYVRWLRAPHPEAEGEGR